jgi:hypothetical protein
MTQQQIAPLPVALLLLLIFTIVPVASYNRPFSRRQLVKQGATNAFAAAGLVAFAAGWPPSDAEAAISEFPLFLRPYTNLAPLGTPMTTSKTAGLSLEDLKVRLERDLVVGTKGDGGYFITGDLSTDIFRDNCIFTDPTNQVSSLSQYQKGVRLLFDPKTSVVELIEPLTIDIERRCLSGTIRSRGMLQLPWHPFISAYESQIVYTIDDAGLVARQDQTWSKAADVALRETFTPTINTPPPSCQIPKPADEPVIVTKLFDRINGRRPNEYSPHERIEIAALVDEICNQSWPWSDDLLVGQWMLSFLQPGPDGAGIDRRVPFPEFDFNDSFQIFHDNEDGLSVCNVGQVLGSLVEVRVAGSLQRDVESQKVATPMRFLASIQRGELCVFCSGSEEDETRMCLPLPISGVGLFDGLYVGRRLRIGQNLNGGGARVVQVRMP